MVIVPHDSPPAAPDGAAAWELLDRFGLELRRCAAPEDEVRLTLAAVRDALDANLVFWHADGGTDAPQALGQPELSLAWRQQFMRHNMLDGAGEGLFVRHYLDPASKPSSPWPLSAILARMGENGSWLAALRFSPPRLFEANDLYALMLARRLLLNHRQRGLVRDQYKDSLSEQVRALSAALEAWTRECQAAPNAHWLALLASCRQALDALCRHA